MNYVIYNLHYKCNTQHIHEDTNTQAHTHTHTHTHPHPHTHTHTSIPFPSQLKLSNVANINKQFVNIFIKFYYCFSIFLLGNLSKICYRFSRWNILLTWSGLLVICWFLTISCSLNCNLSFKNDGIIIFTTKCLTYFSIVNLR